MQELTPASDRCKRFKRREVGEEGPEGRGRGVPRGKKRGVAKYNIWENVHGRLNTKGRGVKREGVRGVERKGTLGL